MTAGGYPGIRFPDRAEALSEFSSYRVFLDPWEPLADELRVFYEGLSLRKESRILAVHGAQGTGKTMFASKFQGDFIRSKEGAGFVEPDINNLWHRVVGGSELRAELIREANDRSDLLLVEGERNWVTSTTEWLKHRQDRRCIIIADNAERAYFRQGLVDMTDADFVRLANEPALNQMAAQRLVTHCRSVFRGALFIILSNDETFLLSLDSEVQAQHAGLLTLTKLPVPDPKTKETVVRVNTNRLNAQSYWYCLDKAGPDEKLSVHSAISGASNFPDSFRAVDTAIRTATPTRIGRPARQNVITLVALVGHENVEDCDIETVGEGRKEEVRHGWLSSSIFSEHWAPAKLGERECELLQSEWQLRVIILGAPAVRSILQASEVPHLSACVNLFELLKVYHGPGTRDTTRANHKRKLEDLVDSWPSSSLDLRDFWSRGQGRSHAYEEGLRKFLPGYDTGSEGFLKYRPDFVISPFRPCSIVSAVEQSQDAINAAIRRDAHVLEFTAFETFDSDALMDGYASRKFTNYVEVMQEQ